MQRFAASHLRGMGEHLATPDVIAETIAEHRDLWVRLYLVTNGSAESESRTERRKRPLGALCRRHAIIPPRAVNA